MATSDEEAKWACRIDSIGRQLCSCSRSHVSPGLGQRAPHNRGAQVPEANAKPWLPPRWFMRLFWFSHRRLYRLTGGRVGLWRPKPNGWGALRVNTIGRRTGVKRSVMVGYFEDGPNLVTLAMNGWGEGEPAWWLNLQAHPVVRVYLRDGSRTVAARTAHGEER